MRTDLKGCFARHDTMAAMAVRGSGLSAPLSDSSHVHAVTEDTTLIAQLYRVFPDPPADVHVHRSADDFLCALGSEGIACVLVDTRVTAPRRLGWRAQLEDGAAGIPLILVVENDADGALAARWGVFDVLCRPLTDALLLSRVERAWKLSRAMRRARDGRGRSQP